MSELERTAENVEKITQASIKVSADGKILLNGEDVTKTLTQILDREKGVLKGVEELKQFQNDTKSFMKSLAKSLGVETENVSDAKLSENIATKLQSVNSENAEIWIGFKKSIMSNPKTSILGLSVLGYMISTGDLDPIHATLKVVGKDMQGGFQSVFGDHWQLIFWVIVGCLLLVFITVLIAKTKRTVRNINKF